MSVQVGDLGDNSLTGTANEANQIYGGACWSLLGAIGGDDILTGGANSPNGDLLALALCHAKPHSMASGSESQGSMRSAGLFSTTVTQTRPSQETNSCSCEPYILVTSIDLYPPRPQVEVLLYGAWQSSSSGDAADIRPLVWQESVWMLDLTAPLATPHDMILLVSLIEHSHVNPYIFRSMVEKAVIGVLEAGSDLPRDMRIAKLIEQIDRVIDFANGGPNFTSSVELSLAADDILHLEANGYRRFVRSFCGYGGQYCLGIELIKAESDLWPLVSRQDQAFACGHDREGGVRGRCHPG